ncbi:MAG: type I-E CRISPR-associated endonuclease Cas1 [Caldilineae bacterium]|nr:MAG: type I-E CRISPR-associated endonuclease Cas1 [Caldilineae bacterium]
MLPHSYRDLPRVGDSISYLYFEYGRVEQTRLGVEYVNKDGRTLLPVAGLTTLLLGPGTTVTHAAVRTLTRAGCLIVWVGEEGVRCYAQGLGETHKAYKLMRQAALASDPDARMQVVERMYRFRFREPLPEGLSIEQVRGFEGRRVRDAYAEAAARHGLTWHGRHYDRGNWDAADPMNRALSAANACLNGLAHAAILSAGYSTGLGFIHQGKQLAFVYDIADLYKTRLSVPVAFATVAEVKQGTLREDRLEREVRKRMRQAFRNMKLLARIVPDIDRVLDLERDLLPDGFDPDDDPALPTPWWTPPGGGDGQ